MTCVWRSSTTPRMTRLYLSSPTTWSWGLLSSPTSTATAGQSRPCFKWIKGNLTIKSLWGYSENAVKIHLWVAISSYLMLAWLKAALRSPLTITEVTKVIEGHILSKADLKTILDVPEPLTQNQDVNELEFSNKYLSYQ